MKKLVLVGGSGSIGNQVMDIVRSYPEEFQLMGLAVGTRIENALATDLEIPYLCVKRVEDVAKVKAVHPNATVYYGDEGLLAMASLDCDLFINALVGFAGLAPTVCAIEHHNDVALANKESLVVGGELVNRLLKENNVKLLPIDSEHSAIHQCLNGNNKEEVERLIITASGGALRDFKREDLATVTAAVALKHPNWSMGAKITIDSATMMNKGFEVIEAHYLFDIPYEKIDTIMHRQSLIHSMVEYRDHSIIAQMGTSDMRIPIQYALTYPARFTMNFANRLDLFKYSNLTFEELSFERFPLLALAYKVGKAKGIWPCVLNAANEVCVHAFLDDRINLLQLEAYIMQALEHFENHDYNTLAELQQVDLVTRAYVNELIERGQ